MRVAQRLPQRVLERRRPDRAGVPSARPRTTCGAWLIDSVPPASTTSRLAEQDLLGALDDRLEAGAAEPVDRERRGLDREAGAEADVAREVDGVGGGLEDVAEDDVVDGGGLDAGAVEGGPGGERRRGRWRRGP